LVEALGLQEQASLPVEQPLSSEAALDPASVLSQKAHSKVRTIPLLRQQAGIYSPGRGMGLRNRAVKRLTAKHKHPTLSQETWITQMSSEKLLGRNGDSPTQLEFQERVS
jgi:hypothetical protein